MDRFNSSSLSRRTARRATACHRSGASSWGAPPPPARRSCAPAHQRAPASLRHRRGWSASALVHVVAGDEFLVPLLQRLAVLGLALQGDDRLARQLSREQEHLADDLEHLPLGPERVLVRHRRELSGGLHRGLEQSHTVHAVPLLLDRPCWQASSSGTPPPEAARLERPSGPMPPLLSAELIRCRGGQRRRPAAQ